MKERFTILLFVLLVYTIINPILSPYPFGSRVIDLSAILLFFSCIYAISDNRKHFAIAVILFALSALAKSSIFAAGTGDYRVLIRSLDLVFSAGFFGYTGLLILGYVLKDGKVTRDKIAAAVCVYLILGIIWSMFYVLAETLDPGAMGGSGLSSMRTMESAVYYSFITLTTVGYGDVVPVSPVAHSLAMVEGIVGQIYLAVMIARLVGLYTRDSALKG